MQNKVKPLTTQVMQWTFLQLEYLFIFFNFLPKINVFVECELLGYDYKHSSVKILGPSDPYNGRKG